MNKRLANSIESEIQAAAASVAAGDSASAFRHLERAHVLGQSSTYQHTRIHWLMLKHGIRERDVKEIAGQVLRIGGAATKTPLGIYPKGNTGGAGVSPFRPMPIDEDLEAILKAAERK
jgi:hypothetical protein